MSASCPTCGRDRTGAIAGPALSVGTAAALVGGLALLAAYYMPWFGMQGLLLSGDFLSRFLGNPAQLRQFAPALAGNPSEVQGLRALVMLFPICGAVATALALARGLWPGRPRWLGALLAAAGLVPLVAVVGGMALLPAGAATEVGLWVMGLGGLLIVVGPWLDGPLARRAAERSATGEDTRWTPRHTPPGA